MFRNARLGLGFDPSRRMPFLEPERALAASIVDAGSPMIVIGAGMGAVSGVRPMTGANRIVDGIETFE